MAQLVDADNKICIVPDETLHIETVQHHSGNVASQIAWSYEVRHHAHQILVGPTDLSSCMSFEERLHAAQIIPYDIIEDFLSQISGKFLCKGVGNRARESLRGRDLFGGPCMLLALAAVHRPNNNSLLHLLSTLAAGIVEGLVRFAKVEVSIVQVFRSCMTSLASVLRLAFAAIARDWIP